MSNVIFLQSDYIPMPKSIGVPTNNVGYKKPDPLPGLKKWENKVDMKKHKWMKPDYKCIENKI